MNVADAVYGKVKALPAASQREVLDFVDYLSQKLRMEDTDSSGWSLSSALRGMEDERWPEYRDQDLTERWQ